MTELCPVFLTPMGRTGGTLFITMLDAHPDLAMSYEIYEDRLISDSGAPLNIHWVIDQIRASTHVNGDQTEWIRSLPDKNLQTFIFRACRAGLDVPEILEEFQRFADDACNLDSLEGRLEFIDRLMRRKMRKTGKRIWGGKARIDPRHLHQRHPNARFFAMIRDGRDVLASMLKTGSFQTNPQRAAQEWTDHIRNFRHFARLPGVSAMEVPYERLVHHPQEIMQQVCEFIGVAFNPSVVQYDPQSLALLKNPYGHLSHKQISQGLNDQSIGRWRKELDPDQVSTFTSVAGELLRELGYL